MISSSLMINSIVSDILPILVMLGWGEEEEDGEVVEGERSISGLEVFFWRRR